MILDIGPDTAERLAKLIADAGTIVWNGPVGVFEFDQFGEGTRAIANAIASSKAFSLAGGGDTLAAIEKYGVEDGISYISTGGGAFLEFVEGKRLPAVAVLEERAQQADDVPIEQTVEAFLRRTKIVATLGPATDDPDVLADMCAPGSTWRASTSRTAAGRAAPPHPRDARGRAKRRPTVGILADLPARRSASRASRTARCMLKRASPSRSTSRWTRRPAQREVGCAYKDSSRT